MNYIKRVKDFEKIKLLSDSRRLAILRLLMKEPATLTQLGKALSEHPAHVRHHLKVLEETGFVELVEERIVSGYVEKFYEATARTFILQELILPAFQSENILIVMGSHDLALEILAEEVSQRSNQAIEMFILPVGSLEGLISLRRELAQVASCHLLDSESGEYNIPYIRHLLPDMDVELLTLAYRQQGLLVQPDNPLNIKGIKDLTGSDVTFMNRNPGSGTRLWFDRQLQIQSISSQEIRGYENEVRTHTEVAQALARGNADAGIGLQATAAQFALGFIPLFKERFDLVTSADFFNRPMMRLIEEILNSREFKARVESLGGYETGHTGEHFSIQRQ